MIINLWSTPRTGSVWYSYHLKDQYPESVLSTEMFNPRHMNLYFLQNETNGSYENFHKPVVNGFYVDYYFDTNNFICKRKVYGVRERDIPQEEEYLFSLIKNRNANQTLIMHNHISPMNTNIRSYLIEQGKQNIWIFRKNKRQQLASYAIALATRQFSNFISLTSDSEQVPDCDIGLLENLIERIKLWDSFPKTDVIAFEDIKFYNKSGFPKDQNSDPLTRVSSRIKHIIEELVSYYENNTN